VTDVTVAVKLVLVAFAGTTTVAGTVTAVLLLPSPTLTPPLPAAELSVAVHVSLPAPVSDALLQETPLNAPDTAVPVPLSPMIAVPLVEELLWMVSWPVTPPVAVGSNCTFSVTDCVGFKVTGKVAPDIVKPAPVNVAELMVTASVPVEVSVTADVVGVFNVTLPNARLAGVMVNVGFGTTVAVPVPLRLTTAVLLVDESLWIVSCPETAPAVAGSNCTFRVTDCPGFKVTGKVVPDTVKSIPVSLAELMVTGVVPVEVSVTGCVDAMFSVTSPNIRLTALSVNCGLVVVVPVPLRLTTAALLVDESLWIVSWSVTAPMAVGWN
jgi:hypothetical protein